jgi:transposase
MANDWMSEEQWAVVEPLIPEHRRGIKPKRNREVISGIVHVLRVGCRWRDLSGAIWSPHHHLGRVAARYEKPARNFRATVTLAILFRWISS